MQRRLCSAILVLQAIVLGLSTLVLVFNGDDVSDGQGLAIGVGLFLACILTAGMLRKRWAYAVGWLIQACSLALGFLTPVMIVLGVIFAVLWFTAYRLGATIDRDKAAVADA